MTACSKKKAAGFIVLVCTQHGKEQSDEYSAAEKEKYGRVEAKRYINCTFPFWLKGRPGRMYTPLVLAEPVTKRIQVLIRSGFIS
jgi:hypothetical protein